MAHRNFWPAFGFALVALLSCGSPTRKAAEYSKPRCLSAEIKSDDKELLVTNKSTEPWTDIEVTLNPTDPCECDPNSSPRGFRKTVERIEAGGTAHVPFRELIREGDGLRFDSEKYAIENTRLLATQGLYGDGGCPSEDDKRRRGKFQFHLPAADQR